MTNSYVTADGRRYDHKGGTQYGKWDAHGKLDKYIEYESGPVLKTLKVVGINIKDKYIELVIEE